VDGRSELWRRPFDLDAVEQGAPHLDPFKVGKEPELFRLAMTDLLDKVADMFVKDLTPKNRKNAAPLGDTMPDTVPSAVTPAPTPPAQLQLPAGELPDPDA
jgi:hypothetical protein